MRWFFKAIPLLIFFYSLQNSACAQVVMQSQYKDASSELAIPTETQLFKDDPDPVVMSAQIAVRLKKIQHTIPLDYNEHVQKYISYNVKRKEHFAKMLGRAKKFFPVFESILAKYGVPEEMKYLAVVESALNPFAVSPKGASGLWQFMYSTGLRYDLNISKRVDERKDPYKACEGAARYLNEMYNLYGNWQLAIASYNCGAGNVNRAIKKAGGSHSFWDIRSFLPAETQAYVPSFIAMVYAMKYAKQYGISPMVIDREITERITTRQKITVNDLEGLLGIARQIIIDENPSLLTTLIPADFTLNLPVSKIALFSQTQDSLYNKAENITIAQTLDIPRVVKPGNAPKELPVSAEVNINNSGNDLSKKDQSESAKTETKTENTSLFKRIKDRLKISDEQNQPVAKSEAVSKKSRTPSIVKNENSTDKVDEKINVTPQTTIKSNGFLKEDDDNYRVVVYKVKPGDNPGYISSWFHCTVKEIRRWNNLNSNLINVDEELLIYVHNNDYRKFIRFNYLSNRIKDILSSKIQTQEESGLLASSNQKKENTTLIEKINPVRLFKQEEGCFETHQIKSGENLWTIAQQFDDVSIQDLMIWNNFKKTPILHKGDEIKVRKIPCR